MRAQLLLSPIDGIPSAKKMDGITSRRRAAADQQVLGASNADESLAKYSAASRAIVLQQKTKRPVQFEITEPTRDAIGAWIG